MVTEGSCKSNSLQSCDVCCYRWSSWSKSNSKFNSLQKFKISCIPEIQDFFTSEKRNKLLSKYLGFTYKFSFFVKY